MRGQVDPDVVSMIDIKQKMARQRNSFPVDLNNALMFHLFAILLELELFKEDSSGEIFPYKSCISVCHGRLNCMFMENNVNQNNASMVTRL